MREGGLPRPRGGGPKASGPVLFPALGYPQPLVACTSRKALHLAMELAAGFLVPEEGGDWDLQALEAVPCGVKSTALVPGCLGFESWLHHLLVMGHMPQFPLL